MPAFANHHLDRLLQEISAAPTRRTAEDIFWDCGWVFLGMSSKEREDVYTVIEDLIKEKQRDT